MIPFPFIFRDDAVLPLYRQLYESLKKEIICGNLRSGDRLPSKRKLSSNAKISQSTIETAYGQLIAEGYIRSVAKSGYYVCKLEGAAPVQRRALPSSGDSDNNGQAMFQYDFQTNTVDTSLFPFATWSRISREIIHDENRGILKASHPQGDYALRRSIAGYLHEFRGVNCLPEQIVIGAGTEYLLGLIIQILGRGNVFAVENPGYRKTYQILKSNSADVALVGLDQEGLSVLELERSGAGIIYVTPSHHFPLGVVMPVSRRLRLLNWANQDEHRYIIEDDYDSEFRFSGKPIPSLQGLNEEKVIYLSTFSRSLAPSIRVSYLVLPQKLLEEYRSNFSFYSSTVSRFEQFIICRFIQDGHFERHLNRMRNLYKARKDVLVEQIKTQLGDRVEIIGENAGLHLLLKARQLKEKEMISWAAKAGVHVYGLSEYYIKPMENMPDNIVLLGYASFTPAQIAEAIAILKEAWLCGAGNIL